MGFSLLIAQQKLFGICSFLSDPSPIIALPCHVTESMAFVNFAPIIGFVKVVTFSCVSCSLPNKTKLKFDQDFKAWWTLKLLLWTSGVEWVKILNSLGPLCHVLGSVCSCILTGWIEIVQESGSGFTSFQSLDIEKAVHFGLYRNPMILFLNLNLSNCAKTLQLATTSWVNRG